MLQDKSFLAVIPARGKSKGYRGKNTKMLFGYPLVAWPIIIAKKSGIFDRVIVYSDSSEILDIAKYYKADVMREPNELAMDNVLVGKAMVDCLKRVEESDKKYDYVQLLQATNPGVRPTQIIQAAKDIIHRKADMIMSVHKFNDPSIVVKRIPRDLSLKGWYPEEFKNKNRQDLLPAYRLNGYIYLAKWNIWAEEIDYWNTNIYAFVCSPEDSIDINTRADFEFAETMLRRKRRLKP